MDRPRTSREALALSLEWAGGTRSNLNTFMDAEVLVDDRTQTLAHVALADGATAAMWAVIAASMSVIDGQLHEGSLDDEGLLVPALTERLSEIREELAAVMADDAEGRRPDFGRLRDLTRAAVSFPKEPDPQLETRHLYVELGLEAPDPRLDDAAWLRLIARLALKRAEALAR